MARTATTTQKRISKRTVSYTTKEVVCLYRSWIAISQMLFVVSSKGEKLIGRGSPCISTSAGNLNHIVVEGNCPFKRDSPSSLTLTNFAALLRISSHYQRAAPA
jgi:hypothetical protein